MRPKWVFLWALVMLGVVQTGCAGMLRNMAEEVTPAVISSAIDELADPKTQTQIVEAIDEEHVKIVSARLSAGFVDGVLDTLENPARRRRLEALLAGLATKTAGTVVDTMMARILDEEVQTRMRLTLRLLVTDLISAVFEIVDVQAGDAEEWNRALGAAAHEIVKQATLGFQDALDDTRRDRADGTMAQEDGALLIAAGNASATGSRIVWTLGIGLAAIAVGLVIMLIWAIRKNRLRRNELAERDDALSVLAEAINATATKPGADELLTVLKAAIHDRPGGKHIRRVLGVDRPS
jgi:hypothetical protein